MGRIFGTFLVAGILGLTLTVWTPDTAVAQRAYTSSAAYSYASSMGSSSPLSPYLNLNRQGTSAANNYYNLVKPQINSQKQFSQQQRQINNLRRETSAGYQSIGRMLREGNEQIGLAKSQRSVGRGTGHPTVFGDTFHFYGR